MQFDHFITLALIPKMMYIRVQSDQVQGIRFGCGDGEEAKVKVKGG